MISVQLLALALAAPVLRAQNVVIEEATDTEIRVNEPDAAFGDETSVSVDLSSGGGETQGLLKFDLSSVSTATEYNTRLSLLTVSSTSGSISAYRMIQSWDETSTWNEFGEDGVTPDGIEAETTPSFILHKPESGNAISVDVTTDVDLWLAGTTNEGWVFLTNSTDGWDFNTGEANLQPPRLTLVDKSQTFAADLSTGTDNEIRSNFADSPLGVATTITVDLSDGGIAQGLMKFDLTGILSASSATLKILTVSSTSGTVSGYRMLQEWDSSSTWSSFGGDGIQADDNEAASEASFEIVSPTSGDIVEIDVTEDVIYWLGEDSSLNQGWAFLSDSSDGWDFTTFESSVNPPVLSLTSNDPLPTVAPTAQPGVMTTVLDEAVDTELRAIEPDTPYGDESSVSVDLSSGGGETQGLLKFDLSDVTSVSGQTATLTLLTVSSTSGTISAYRMIQSWDESSVWSAFGDDGVTPDGVEAESTYSFQIHRPQSGNTITIDVTDDVDRWLSGETNEGWVFLTNSTDGWDFNTGEASLAPPTLTISAAIAEATPYPTGMFNTELTLATDAEIRSNLPDTPLGDATSITVDLSDGGTTQGLLKFALDGFPSVSKAELEVLTVSGTSGTIRAYRMLESWDATATWNSFGGDGIQANDVEAASVASFEIVFPSGGETVRVDCTEDVKFWVDGGLNEGWVFINDSGDGWDFNTAEANLEPPTLFINSDQPLPTAAPTPGPDGSEIDLIAVDTEIRSDQPSTPFGDATTITIDLDDGGVTQGLVKFDLSTVADAASEAMLRILTVSSTGGTVTAYRMLQAWDESSTWSTFGGDGVQPDDVEARSEGSFEIVAPRSGNIVEVDVLEDVQFWQSGGTNEGWVFITDSGDGWDINAGENDLFPPTLAVKTSDGTSGGSGSSDKKKKSNSGADAVIIVVIVVVVVVFVIAAFLFGICFQKQKHYKSLKASDNQGVEFSEGKEGHV